MKRSHAWMLCVGMCVLASLVGCSSGDQGAAPEKEDGGTESVMNTEEVDGEVASEPLRVVEPDGMVTGNDHLVVPPVGPVLPPDILEPKSFRDPSLPPSTAMSPERSLADGNKAARSGEGTLPEGDVAFFMDESAGGLDAESETPRGAVDTPPGDGPFASLPAGASFSEQDGYATVQVYYGTDRAAAPLPLSAYSVAGNQTLVISVVVIGLLGFLLAVFSLFRGRSAMGACAGLVAGGCGLFIVLMVSQGTAGVAKTGIAYTGGRGVLTQGIAEVTVPATHERGELESPSLLRLEFAEDQRKHIVLASATELSESDFYRRLQESVRESSEGELMVFIHGYNVDFESAVRRTAQLAVDLPFQGVPVCYSWPSLGTLFGYTVDENNVAWSSAHLREFLLDLVEQSGAKSINVVAHSMGNRALTTALSEISMMRGEEPDTPFDRVVLAAPDVDAGLFAKDLAPRMLRIAESVTLYASSDDKALVASKQVHGYPRAGEGGANIVVVPGVETIDVTGIDLSLLGHSYYGDTRAMLVDMRELLQERLPAHRRRMLQTQALSGLTYWRLLPARLAESITAPAQ